MKQLLIVGAGGFGREAFALAREAVGYGTEFTVKGFLDARADALAGFENYPPVLGSPDSYAIGPDDVFITAVGSIDARRGLVAKIAAKGGRFISLVHKSAFLGVNVTLGEGSYISNNVTLTADIRVGRHVCIFQNVSIGHDSELGDFSHVYAQCALGGGVKLGEGASVYPGAVLLPRRTIGENAVVGAGSTVIVNVAAGETVFGSPAAPVKGKIK